MACKSPGLLLELHEIRSDRIRIQILSSSMALGRTSRQGLATNVIKREIKKQLDSIWGLSAEIFVEADLHVFGINLLIIARNWNVCYNSGLNCINDLHSNLSLSATYHYDRLPTISQK